MINIDKISTTAQFIPQSFDELHFVILPMIKQNALWVGFAAERISTGEALDRGIVYRGEVNDLFYDVAIVWGSTAGTYAARYVLRSTQPVVAKALCQPCYWSVEHDCSLLDGTESWVDRGAIEKIRERQRCDWTHDFSLNVDYAAVFTSLDDVYEAHQVLAQCDNWTSDVILHVMPVSAVGRWDEQQHRVIDVSEFDVLAE